MSYNEEIYLPKLNIQNNLDDHTIECSMYKIFSVTYSLWLNKLWPQENAITREWNTWIYLITEDVYTPGIDKSYTFYFKFLKSIFYNIEDIICIYEYEFLKLFLFYLDQQAVTSIFYVPKTENLLYNDITKNEKLREIFQYRKSTLKLNIPEYKKYPNATISNSQLGQYLDYVVSEDDYEENNLSKRVKISGGKKLTKKNININKKFVKRITDNFIYNVVKTNDSNKLNKLFCNKGYLIGTLSRKTRKKTRKKKAIGEIKEYFNYFAKLKGIKVVSKDYDIEKIGENIYLNQATIEWIWDDKNKPVTARMSFIIKDKCIFLLHSSQLPPVNNKIK